MHFDSSQWNIHIVLNTLEPIICLRLVCIGEGVGCYDYTSLEAFETARQQTASTLRSVNQFTLLEQSYIKGFAYFGGLSLYISSHGYTYYKWGTKAMGKIVDGKGNIQSGKKGVLLGSMMVIITNPKA